MTDLVTRWKEASGGSTFFSGTSTQVAGMQLQHAIDQSTNKQLAENSYEITFDYGTRRVVVAHGMTEILAARLMEAFEGALAKA